MLAIRIRYYFTIFSQPCSVQTKICWLEGIFQTPGALLNDVMWVCKWANFRLCIFCFGKHPTNSFYDDRSSLCHVSIGYPFHISVWYMYKKSILATSMKAEFWAVCFGITMNVSGYLCTFQKILFSFCHKQKLKVLHERKYFPKNKSKIVNNFLGISIFKVFLCMEKLFW